MTAKSARTKSQLNDYIRTIDRQNRRCWASGVELTPSNVYGVAISPEVELTTDNIIWCDRRAGKMLDGMNVDDAIALMERILRYRKPELFKDRKEANSNVAVG